MTRRGFSFYWDKPGEPGCRGFALRPGRAAFSFTWSVRDDYDRPPGVYLEDGD